MACPFARVPCRVRSGLGRLPGAAPKGNRPPEFEKGSGPHEDPRHTRGFLPSLPASFVTQSTPPWHLDRAL